MTTVKPLSEDEFQAELVKAANLLGWHTMHVRRSKVRGDKWATATSHDGWPDLVLWRVGLNARLIVAELKSNRGTATPKQLHTLRSIQAAGVDAYIWRPRDWDQIEEILRGGRRHAQLHAVELHPGESR